MATSMLSDNVRVGSIGTVITFRYANESAFDSVLSKRDLPFKSKFGVTSDMVSNDSKDVQADKWPGVQVFTTARPVAIVVVPAYLRSD